MKKILIAVIFSYFMVGCASHGREITDAQISSIQTGQSTKSQMLKLFGPPVTRGRDNNGYESLSWMHLKTGFAATSMKQKILTISFTPSGLVESYAVQDTAP